MSDYDVLKQGMYVTIKAVTKKEHEKAPDLMPVSYTHLRAHET